jgi:hypothetical protein
MQYRLGQQNYMDSGVLSLRKKCIIQRNFTRLCTVVAKFSEENVVAFWGYSEGGNDN